MNVGVCRRSPNFGYSRVLRQDRRDRKVCFRNISKYVLKNVHVAYALSYLATKAMSHRQKCCRVPEERAAFPDIITSASCVQMLYSEQV